MLIIRAERYVRQAHNLKVVGSNPTPATKRTNTFLINTIVQTELKNYEKAINSYKEVQKIYPSMQAPKVMIPRLKVLIKDQSI